VTADPSVAGFRAGGLDDSEAAAGACAAAISGNAVTAASNTDAVRKIAAGNVDLSLGAIDNAPFSTLLNWIYTGGFVFDTVADDLGLPIGRRGSKRCSAR
jgi:molybdate-binding protein